jgi:hypothetical protein
MFKRIFSFEYTPIIALLILCLAIGVFTVKGYGESWDEAEIFDYADYSIQAYQYILHPQELQPFSRDLNYYGPAYFMLADSSSNLITLVAPSISLITARHFIYFSTLLACILFLYLLSQRWMSRWAAFGATLLFTSQPLIWGHSFINPKDIPFMTFFLISVYLSFQMMDASLNSKWKWIIPAGIILGLTISMRVIGPLAGLFVIFYGLLKFPRKIITTIPYYFLIAGVATYLTWPYLWKAPIINFFESLKVMSRFPYTGPVLFMGSLYPANQLPRRYFPTLLSFQLTEPTLILIAIGFVISIWFFIRGKNREPVLLFAGWFLAPVVWIILSRSALYDNARQLLFLWPPLFVLVGMGIDQLMIIIKLPTFRIALLLIAVLPGIYACVHLYPYEYIYYNGLTGGVKGAYRNFELDYWATSFQDSVQYLNQNAGQGTTILVNSTRQLARQYARPDLSIIVLNKANMTKSISYYILFSTRSNSDLSYCSSSAIVYTVERDGGILSYVKKIDPEQSCN